MAALTGKPAEKPVDPQLVKAIMIFENVKKVANKKNWKMDIDTETGKIKTIWIEKIIHGQRLEIPVKPIIAFGELQLYVEHKKNWTFKDHKFFKNIYLKGSAIFGEHINYTPHNLPEEYRQNGQKLKMLAASYGG